MRDDDNGPIDLCASVCVVDEYENVILSAYVRPGVPVTDYRHTGLSEEQLKDGMALEEVRKQLLKILRNGDNDGTGTVLLVGHGLRHHMNCLKLEYPSHLMRDTAKYVPLLKTNLASHSLKYLTKSYLGYDIQSETLPHDPYKNCVSAMRLYKRMRDQEHGEAEGSGLDSCKLSELDEMEPLDLYCNSTSEYRCWCLDGRPCNSD